MQPLLNLFCILRTLSSTLPGITGLHFKIVALSVLYDNEKVIYYDPDCLSALSCAHSGFFVTTFLGIAVCQVLLGG